MLQDERTRQARTQIEEAALRLFSHQGYRGTSMRDIAEEAGFSTGAVYHHYPDKETLFRSLLETYWKAIESPDFPVNKALAAGAFPDDLEALGRASRESVLLYKEYVALIYVDVVEFEGEHIRKFYSTMAKRFETFLTAREKELALEPKLQPGVSPLSAIMLTSRIFLNYFAVELLFGVPNHFGKDSETVLGEISNILRRGLLRAPEAPAVREAAVRAPARRKAAKRGPRPARRLAS